MKLVLYEGFLRTFIGCLLCFGTAIVSHAKPNKGTSAKSLALTSEHAKSFSIIARLWNGKDCETENPKLTTKAIEKSCQQARSQSTLNQPVLVQVSGSNYVQCTMTSALGFLEVSFGTKEKDKLIINHGVAEFKLEPRGSIAAIAQNNFSVGTDYCEELEGEINTRASMMNYNMFQSLFINQYSSGKKITPDQFFNTIAKLNLCYQHHPNFVSYRCSKFFAKQKKASRGVASEAKKPFKSKHNFRY